MKFYGKIGFVEEDVETAPGVFESKITEREYYGEYVRNMSSRTENSGGANDNIIIENNISIVADPYAYEHSHNMKYVESMGAKWKITKVEVQRPRIILTTGGVYNAKPR